MKILYALLFLITTGSQFSCMSSQTETLVYFGTYTRGSSEGVYVSKLNKETGVLTPPVLAAKFSNPSFAALHPNKKFLYAVAEEAGDKAVVGSFSIEPDGTLTQINQQSSLGNIPCHLTVDATGKTLIVANYGGATCASFPIAENGAIGAGTAYKHTGRSVTKRQSQPNPHSVNIDIQNKRALVSDLGIDKIVVYNLNTENSKLEKHSAISMPPGGGPRHLSFHPKGKFAYSNLEISRQIATLSYDSDKGILKQLQVLSTVPENETEGSTAECLVHPSGKWVYVSNRGNNSIAVFAINQETGLLTKVEIEPTLGSIPRGFGIDPSGQFIIVGHQMSDKVNVFRINQKTGELDFTGNSVKIDSAVNVRFVEK